MEAQRPTVPPPGSMSATNDPIRCLPIRLISLPQSPPSKPIAFSCSPVSPPFRKAPWLDLVAPFPRPGLLAQTPVPLPLRVPSRVKSCYPINSYVPHHICSLNRNVSPRPGVGEGTGSGSWIGRGRGWEEGVLGEDPPALRSRRPAGHAPAGAFMPMWTGLLL